MGLPAPVLSYHPIRSRVLAFQWGICVSHQATGRPRTQGPHNLGKIYPHKGEGQPSKKYTVYCTMVFPESSKDLKFEPKTDRLGGLKLDTQNGGSRYIDKVTTTHLLRLGLVHQTCQIYNGGIQCWEPRVSSSLNGS